MKQFLLDIFRFNDQANRKVLTKIRELPDKNDSIRLFSHLINSQDKWLKRISVYPEDPHMDWWEPVYPMEKLEPEWERSLAAWIAFIDGKSDVEVMKPVRWVGFDQSRWTAALKDVALQLNYHSIHHRAQIQALVRAQGLKPDFLDYIGTVYKKIE